MITKIDRKAERARRHTRVRTKISGTTECPRLAVTKSNKNIIAQVIDDVKGETLVYVSTLDKDIKTKAANVEAAKEVGKVIAEKALKKNIKQVVFFFFFFIYHGVVKAVAEAAREAGLDF